MKLNHFYQDLKQLRHLEKSFFSRLIVNGAGIVFLAFSPLLITFGKSASLQVCYLWIGLVLTTPLLIISIFPILRSLFNENAPHFFVDTTLLIALGSSYFYSSYIIFFYPQSHRTYFDSILLILFAIYASHYLEIFCRRRIGMLAQNLSAISSTKVKIAKADMQTELCEIKDILVGDKLYITPGEYFPVDGIICDHDTSVDESMLTGEAHAIAKFTNDTVRGGSCNLDKSVTIQATSTFHDSHFGKILSSLEYPHNHKYAQPSPSDHLGLWFQMLMLSLSAAIYCWWLPFDSQFALFCAISALLITCPCLIAIIYPLTIACILEICAQKGILIKNPLAFFKFAQVEHILFDKTGTLTEGNLIVSKIEYFNHYTQENVLPLIGAIEKNTYHPIAHAIIQYCEKRFPIPSFPIERLRVFPGKGVRAFVKGKFILIGSAYWLRKNGIFIPLDAITDSENDIHADHVFVHCAIEGVEVARIQLKDKIRQEAVEIIHFLNNYPINLTVLSGDRPAVVNAIARQLGSINATAQAIPQEKEAQVAILQNKGYTTAMIGDGFNDAPAVKRSDIGIVMGTGNPITIFCADIVLQNSALSMLKICLLLSLRARQILKQNYAFAIIINLVMLPFAALGQLSSTMMLMSLSLSILLVMANTVRLKFSFLWLKHSV